MKKDGKVRLIAVVMAFLLLHVNAMTAYAQENNADEIFSISEEIVKWQRKNARDYIENAGTAGSDWLIIGMSRLGLDVDYDDYLQALVKTYETKEFDKTTDLSRTILTVLACGSNPTEFGKRNLIYNELFENEKINNPGNQGLNGWLWYLMAMDSLQWKTSESTQFSREYVLNVIIESQQDDGGFSLSGNKSDTDITAMALQAIAPYYRLCKNEKISGTVDKGRNYLRNVLNDNGKYETCETTAQVLCAIASLGKGNELVESELDVEILMKNLLEFRNTDGGFSHIKGEESNLMATVQALVALAATARYEKKLNSVYDFTEEKQPTTQYAELNEMLNDMQKNESGNGCIYDVENDKAIDTNTKGKAKNDTLITELNKKISEEFYPFDNLTNKQLETLEKLYLKAQNLSENERQEIIGYDEMKRLFEEDKDNSILIILVIICITVGISVVCIVYKRCKNMKGNK